MDSAGSNQASAVRQGLTALALAPDGKQLASLNPAGAVELRALPTGEFLGTLPAANAAATGLAYSPDGSRLAAVLADGRIGLWDPKAPDDPPRLLAGHDSAPIERLLFAPDGASLATSGGDQRIIVWDEATGEPLQVLEGHAGAAILALAFSPDGRALASRGTDGRLKLWDLRSGEEARALEGFGGGSDSLDFDATGRILAAVDGNGRVAWLDAAGDARNPPLQGQTESPALAVFFSPEGSTLAAAGSDGSIFLWDTASGRLRPALAGFPGSRVAAAVFDPTGKVLAAAGEGGQIALWNALTGEPLPAPAAGSEPVAGLAFSSDGKILAGQTRTGEVIAWAIPGGEKLLAAAGPAPTVAQFAPEPPVASAAPTAAPAARAAAETPPAPAAKATPAATPATAAAPETARPGAAARRGRTDWKGLRALAVSKDGKDVVTASEAGVLARASVDGTPRWSRTGHNGRAINAVAFTDDGEKLVTASDDSTLKVWNAATGEQELLLQGFESSAVDVDVDAAGTIAAAAQSTRVLRWNAQGKLLAVLNEHKNIVNAIAYSPNGKTLATGSADSTVKLWDADTNRSVRTLAAGSPVLTLDFSADGRLLAVGCEDGSILVFDVQSGNPVRKLEGHTAAVRSVEFQRNGNLLASSAADGTVLTWDLNGNAPKARLPTGQIVNALVFGPEGQLLGAGEGLVVDEWDAATGKLQSERPAPAGNPPSGPANPEPQGAAPDGSALVPAALGRVEAALAALPGRLLDWLVKPAAAEGPGGPILVVTSGADGFSQYYKEILRTEGFNAFAEADVSALSAAALAGYDVVILSPAALSSAQATILADWVNGGGNLIAMRPSAQLAGLLGIQAQGSTRSNGYLLFDTSRSPGRGIVGQTLQFHGTADNYTLNGAVALATLYSTATAATSNPAVTLRSVGTNGGQAVAFAFDLARSIVYTRQGNPAWAAQERDGFSPIRSDDKFYGNLNGDPQPDWVDLGKVAIPQADEQQRFLANLILEMNRDRKPLPRFWYFPRGEKAVVIMTGDDHGNGGTKGRFDQFLARSPANCSVERWECVRGTSYIYPSTNGLTNADATAYNAAGFEIGLHVSTGCGNYNAASLENNYATQIPEWSGNYPGLPLPITQRHHCIAWSDWVTGAVVQLNHGIRLDTSYYYWPPGWVVNRPGFFTGSGMPMRFADLNGRPVDVYNAASQMTDESGQDYPYTIDTLLDRALGAEGFYGAFTINAHTDVPTIPESDTTVDSALARGVPIITSRQMLAWLDARNGSSFGNLSWSGNALAFTVAPGSSQVPSTASNIGGLEAMLPTQGPGGALASLTRNGSPVSLSTTVVKGVSYGVFSASAGNYVATYGTGGTDTTPPTVASTAPADGATGVSQSTAVTATFSEPMDPGTIDTATFQLRGPAPQTTAVAATVSYNASTNTAELRPSASLAASSSYTATVAGGTSGVTDAAGIPLAANRTWTFTTATASEACATAPCTGWSNSTVPATTSANDPSAVELGVRFRSSVEGRITGIRFYKGTGNTGTHMGKLWSSTGSLLAEATFTGETASGWQQMTFQTPVPITANTVYVASYYAPNGRYAINPGYFSTAGHQSGPLYFLRNGESGGNGVYRYGLGGGFPSSTFNASNYWVDVVLTTGGGGGTDTTAPTAPAGLTATAAGSSTVNLAWTAATDNVGVTGYRVERCQGANCSNFTEVASPTGTSVADSGLTAGTTYRYRVRATDAAGNLGPYSAVASATTGDATATGCSGTVNSLWPNTATPTTPAASDGSSVELGVKFRTDAAGVICGIRFYKGTGNTGTHVGKLWSSTGSLLAQATFTGETASGWQQVLFATPVPVTANTVYVASYLAPAGRYAVDSGADPGAFTAAGLSRPPLYALRNGESGGNGVYRYGTGGFPSSTYAASNYWVDVVFATGVAP
jgi:WD40 repeat protein